MLHTHRFCQSLFSLLIALMWAATSVLPSFADIAPPPPPEGFTILPGSETTQVRMMYEHVFMNIDLDGVAKVDANFVMRNLGSKEESMEVRFPLYSSVKYQEGDLKCGDSGNELSGSPIQDLAVWVWDQPQPVKTVVETMAWYQWIDGLPTENKAVMPCWGVFAVVFPPGIDVPIEVKYTSPTYSYILTTGAGWNGTIGQADITFRLPYDAALGQSLERCVPESCILNGRDIQWKFMDFEPTENVSVAIVQPSVWWRILTELNNLKLNPKNGQAMKRLAIAYKDSIRVEISHGFIEQDPENLKHIQLSDETFRKAISLSLDDPDLRSRFAEFLCTNKQVSYAARVWDIDIFIECVQQLKQALELDPYDKVGLKLLERIAKVTYEEQPVVVMNGAQPDYLVLTPSFVPLPSQTSTTTKTTSPQPTRLPSATRTQAATFTPTLSIQSSLTPSFTPTFLPSTPAPLPTQTETGLEAAWAWALVPLAAILVVIVLRRRSGR